MLCSADSYVSGTLGKCAEFTPSFPVLRHGRYLPGWSGGMKLLQWGERWHWFGGKPSGRVKHFSKSRFSAPYKCGLHPERGLPLPHQVISPKTSQEQMLPPYNFTCYPRDIVGVCMHMSAYEPPCPSPVQPLLLDSGGCEGRMLSAIQRKTPRRELGTHFPRGLPASLSQEDTQVLPLLFLQNWCVSCNLQHCLSRAPKPWFAKSSAVPGLAAMAASMGSSGVGTACLRDSGGTLRWSIDGLWEQLLQCLPVLMGTCSAEGKCGEQCGSPQKVGRGQHMRTAMYGSEGALWPSWDRWLCPQALVSSSVKSGEGYLLSLKSVVRFSVEKSCTRGRYSSSESVYGNF